MSPTMKCPGCGDLLWWSEPFGRYFHLGFSCDFEVQP